MLNKTKVKLTPKQLAFCLEYVHPDSFGNGVQAYMKVYCCKYNTAKTQASEALTNPNICEKITELLDEAGFNDNNADKQLLFCMNQFADLGLKLQAIREYNRVKGRLIKNQNDKTPQFSLIDLFTKEKSI